MTVCAIYTRVSIDVTGDQGSTPRQERLCRRFAADRQWTVVTSFEDVDLSAFKRGVHRPGYESLLRFVAARRADAVLVWRLDRLVRRPAEFERFWAACEETATRVVSVTEHTAADAHDHGTVPPHQRFKSCFVTSLDKEGQ